MMDVIQPILSLILTLGILVTIHEFGHYWVARKCGVKVLRFSVGFGKPLYTWTNKAGTEFVIASIPLGGYVKMLDEREGRLHQKNYPRHLIKRLYLNELLLHQQDPLQTSCLQFSPIG
jgi:regulator of sigma E protease